jgi:hypothetical protein
MLNCKTKNMSITKEQLSETLNGNKIGNEITKEQELQAKESGLVIVFGSSDDLMELRGAFYDEFSCYNGGKIKFTKEGKKIDEDDMKVLQKYNVVPKLNIIEVIWDEGYDTGEGDERCYFQYKTEIPHSIFRIMEGGDLYCVGIIFNVVDLL